MATGLCNKADWICPCVHARARHTGADYLTQEAGCKKVFQEKASGGRWNRPDLHRLLEQLRDDDTVVVWKLDRLCRSLKDLLLILERTTLSGSAFQSVTEFI